MTHPLAQPTTPNMICLKTGVARAALARWQDMLIFWGGLYIFDISFVHTTPLEWDYSSTAKATPTATGGGTAAWLATTMYLCSEDKSLCALSGSANGLICDYAAESRPELSRVCASAGLIKSFFLKLSVWISVYLLGRRTGRLRLPSR